MNHILSKERTFHWQTPSSQASAQMSGIDFLQAMLDGKLPASPLVYTLDFKAETFEEGTAIFSFIPQEFHYNPIGTVHGGVISSILDSAMGCSLHSLLPAATTYTTLELKVNFIKGVTIAAGKLTATGRVIHAGNRTAVLEAQLTGADGKLYAHATSTCMIIKPKQ